MQTSFSPVTPIVHRLITEAHRRSYFFKMCDCPSLMLGTKAVERSPQQRRCRETQHTEARTPLTHRRSTTIYRPTSDSNWQNRFFSVAARGATLTLSQLISHSHLVLAPSDEQNSKFSNPTPADASKTRQSTVTRRRLLSVTTHGSGSGHEAVVTGE